MAVSRWHQGLAGATETNAQSFRKGIPRWQVPQAWAYLKAGGTLFSLEESGLVSTRWDCSPGGHTGRSEHPAPPRGGAQWEHTVESMPLLFPICPIVIADIPFASLWPFPGKSLHKTIKILKCTNKNFSALISQPLHFLIHRRSLITPTILTRSLGLSASSSHLRSDFHVTSVLIWQGSATLSSTILSRSQGFCFLALTLLLHIAEEQ